MIRRIRPHLTYANVMATVAVFLAVGGGGTALAAYVVSSNSQVGPGTISGHRPPAGKHANIVRGSVGATDLAPGSIGSRRLATGAVKAPKLADGSVTGPKLATGSVATEKLQDRAVNTNKIGDGQVKARNLGAINVRTGAVNVASGGSESATAQCHAGERVIGVGTDWLIRGAKRYTSEIHIEGNGARGRGTQSTGFGQVFIVEAYCLSGSLLGAK